MKVVLWTVFRSLSVLNIKLHFLFSIRNYLRFSDLLTQIEELVLNNYCTDTYLLILDSLGNTLHKVLAHSEEFTRKTNAGYALNSLSEEGSEACNKMMRKYRENLARKTIMLIYS